MWTIHLRRDKRRLWFLNVTSGSRIVLSGEDYERPATARKRAIATAVQMPYARVVVHLPDRKTPIVVRGATPPVSESPAVLVERLRDAMA